MALKKQKSGANWRGGQQALRSGNPGAHLDLESYLPHYFNLISGTLTRGSSRLYFRHFGISVIEWRVMGTIAIDSGTTANDVSRLMAIDKAAISRAVRQLADKGLIAIKASDRRRRPLALTPAGRSLHDRILPIALQRERILLERLSKTEVAVLVDLLRRVKAQLDAVNDYDPESST